MDANEKLNILARTGVFGAMQAGVFDDHDGEGGSSGPVDWTEVENKPTFAKVATSGSYVDLNNKPSLFSGAYADLTGKPNLFSGSYADLSNKPTLFSGNYNDLTNKPTIPTAGVANWYREKIQDVAPGGTIVVSNGGFIRSTATGAHTWTFDTTGLTAGYAASWTLKLTNGAAGTQTFTNAKTANGAALTLSSGVDYLAFVWDGTTLLVANAAGDVK